MPANAGCAVEGVCILSLSKSVRYASITATCRYLCQVENVLGRCTASSMAVPSRDRVLSAVCSCSGDEEEAVASLVTSSFLRNIYAAYSTSDRSLQQKSLWLNQELSLLLKDESLPRDVSCYTPVIIFYNCL